MSFGFGVRDFLAVVKPVWDVYSAYADGPKQFRNFSQAILPLYIFIRKIADQLGISGSDASGTAVPGLDTNNQKDLKIVYDGLQAIMKELDDLLKKYQSLESSCNSIDRFKWGLEDLEGLRDKIPANIHLLIRTLAKYVLFLLS